MQIEVPISEALLEKARTRASSESYKKNIKYLHKSNPLSGLNPTDQIIEYWARLGAFFERNPNLTFNQMLTLYYLSEEVDIKGPEKTAAQLVRPLDRDEYYHLFEFAWLFVDEDEFSKTTLLEEMKEEGRRVFKSGSYY